MQKIYINVYFKVYETSDGLSIRLPTLYEELNSPTSPDFPDHARNFSQTKLTCNSYFSLQVGRLLLPYIDSLCYHYHILNH